MLGSDRSVPTVCKLLNKPRTKKEAKTYYKIETEEVNYQAESEDSVSETEIQNILTHYKKLGKNTDRYVESFNNIAAQYTDAQLRVISKFLPLSVRAVLETDSPKYQSIMTFGEGTYKRIEQAKEAKKDNLKIGFIETQNSKTKLTKPVVIPSEVNTESVKKLNKNKTEKEEAPANEADSLPGIDEMFEDIESTENNIPDVEFADEAEENVEEPVKKKRGRPKKAADPEAEKNAAPKKRGRPKKVVEVDETEAIDEDATKQEEVQAENVDEADNTVLPGFEEVNSKDEEPNLFALGEEEKAEPEEKDIENIINNYRNKNNDFTKALTKDKKVVAFVGSPKAGTSFLINNLADMLSKSGIKTAVLDLTQNRNSYYIYTKNEDSLRRLASNCLEKIENGIVEGIDVSRNLSIFTSVPNQQIEVNNVETIVSNLIKKYSLVLLDCDFMTDEKYFELASEIYLVQSMDILTIQPLTAFLRDLQSNNKLDPSKLKCVINKALKVRGLTTKIIIGGMSCYNNPEMSYMRELFDKDKMNAITIPFDEDALSKYLSGLVDCFVSTNGYSKPFLAELKKLGDSVYPLVANRFRPDYSKNNKFAKNNMME